MEKIAFTFWAGEEFSYFNLISLVSFVKLNPEVSLIIYSVSDDFEFQENTWNTGEHQSKIVNKFKIYDLKKLLPAANINFEILDSKKYADIKTPVHLADFIRIEKLFQHGGVWIDSDILFLRQLPPFFFDDRCQLNITSYENTIPTGILGAQKNGAFISELYKLALTERARLHDSSAYQILGPDLWAKLFVGRCVDMSSINFFNSALFYPYMWNEIHNFYGSSFNNRIGGDVYGVHWYNGSQDSKIFINLYLRTALKGGGGLINSTAEQVLRSLIESGVIPLNVLASSAYGL